jgi:DNA-directed RNA polymerase subunit RPC12/RpoP
MSEIPTFAALCADCGKSFGHPLLSDFSYGECIFYTLDGRHCVHANVFVGDSGAFAQRVSALHKRCNCKPGTFWPVLASLADPVAGQAFTSSIRCPHCGSKNLASWGGNKTGSTPVPAASFTSALALSDQEIIERVMAISGATVQA